jgi:hypothetical protein
MDPIRTRESGPWRADGAAQPLLAWSTPQREALGAALARAIAQWREEWGMTVEASPVRCEPATSKAVLRDGWRTLGAGAGAWLHAAGDDAAQIARLLFDADSAGGRVTADVVEACARDARARLAAALRLADGEATNTAPLPGLGQPWSGALQAMLPGTPGWSLLLSAEAVQAWCRASGLPTQGTPAPTSRQPLCSATEALGERALSLNVELSGCELDLGALQSLQIGDVVRLQHALDAPARLTSDEGQLVFDGYLVAQEGRKAIELVKRQPH